MPQKMQDIISEWMAGRMPDRMSEWMPGRMPDRIWEWMPYRCFQMICWKLCQNIVSGWDHSKWGNLSLLVSKQGISLHTLQVAIICNWLQFLTKLVGFKIHDFRQTSCIIGRDSRLWFRKFLWNLEFEVQTWTQLQFRAKLVGFKISCIMCNYIYLNLPMGSLLTHDLQILGRN
jgi:hypothetical protein